VVVAVIQSDIFSHISFGFYAQARDFKSYKLHFSEKKSPQLIQ